MPHVKIKCGADFKKKLTVKKKKKTEQHKSEIKSFAISARIWPLEGKKTFVSKPAPWYLSACE